MGFSLSLARRYIGSKKRNMISVSTLLAVFGVTLGVAALAIVMSVTGGFQEQFRDKVLGVNAHVLVLKYSIDFREYRDVMKKVAEVDGVIGVAPFVINPMMLTHGEKTGTGVLVKGVDAELLPKVLDLPKHIIAGSLEGLRRPGARPPVRPSDPLFDSGDPRSAHTQATTPKKKGAEAEGGLSARRKKAPAPKDDDETDDDEADAPHGDSLIDAIRKSIAEGETRKGATSGAVDDERDEIQKPIHGPVGSIEPAGGYKSALPDDDNLPDSIVPDPCKSLEVRQTLPGIIIGKALARQLDATLGDCIQVTSPQIGLSFGASARPPIAKQFRVSAIFEAGFEQYDAKLAYTDLYEAESFYEYGDSVTGVEMKIRDISKSAAVSKKIEAMLKDSPYSGVYHTMDWQELNHGLFTALWLQQVVMSTFLALIIIVAEFQIIATLTMIGIEKRKEVALLKALGAKDSAILRVFIYHGGFIGLAGITLGLSLAYAACHFLQNYGFPLDPKVYFISSLPVSMHPGEFVRTGLFAMATCLLATIPPAAYAASLRPADGLRSG